MPGASAVRFSGWLCLVLGVAFLFAAAVLGILAMQQATEISVYHHARACLAGAPSNADCLQAVEGSVAGVTESPGSGRGRAGEGPAARTPSTPATPTFTPTTPSPRR